LLQDVQAGRAIEMDGIVGKVQEIGRRLRPGPVLNPTPEAVASLLTLGVLNSAPQGCCSRCCWR
jgi:ketopantoate reductase